MVNSFICHRFFASLTLAVGLTLSVFSVQADSEKQQLFFHVSKEGGWVPFRTSAERGRKGVLEELSDLLQQYSDIEFVPVFFPTKRAEKALIDGLVDFDFICIEWLKNGHCGDNFVISEPFFEVTEAFATLPKNAHLLPTPESAYNQSVGTIGGYFYHDDDRFTRIDFLNENQLVLGLKKYRYKSIIIEKETAKYWAQVHDIEIAFPAVHSKGHLLMRLRDENQHLLPKINQAIIKMKESGQLKAILDKHGVESLIL
jgi:polar amino acid transport system substrate-binding protein